MEMLRTAIFILFSAILSIFDIKILKVPIAIIFALLISLVAFDFMLFRNKMILNAVGAIGCFSILLIAYFLTNKNLGFGDVEFGLSVGWFLGEWLWIPALFLASLLEIGFILLKNCSIQSKRIPFIPFVSATSFCIGIIFNSG